MIRRPNCRTALQETCCSTLVSRLAFRSSGLLKKPHQIKRTTAPADLAPPKGLGVRVGVGVGARVGARFRGGVGGRVWCGIGLVWTDVHN